MQGSEGRREVGDRNQTPEQKGRRREEFRPLLPLPLHHGWNASPSLFSLQPGPGIIRRKAAHLRVVDTQRLDLVKGKQDTDEEHLVLFFQGQGEAIDDAGS